MRQRRKARGGSQIAELAPALLILFIVVLFPMLDVMYIGLGYCCGWYLNHITSRGCSTVAPPDPVAGGPYPVAVINNLNAAWSGTSLSGFTGSTIVSNAASAVPSAVPDPVSGKNTLFVVALTSVKVKPFFTLPSMPLINSLQIDGLTRPVTFTYSDRVPVEETGVN